MSFDFVILNFKKVLSKKGNESFFLNRLKRKFKVKMLPKEEMNKFF